LIELVDVYKSYGSVDVLEAISLKVEDGKIACVLGRSGCGKSTLLKIAALIMAPDRGRVSMSGLPDAAGNTTSEGNPRMNIGYSFQEPLLMPYLNAVENVTLGASGRFRDIEPEARELLKNLGLSARFKHRPSKLSVGEKKRVDLARAFVRKPRLLVADEPFSNLDPNSASLVRGLLGELVDSGGTVLYSAVEPSHSTNADLVIKLA
jgi:ABC-type multidrug transport system ATPase subunit